ncbi:MAG: hypothetical protein SPK61_04850 [Bacteroidales bacterium]|nr:hypothetical protein [Bacteroidales bacterium]MDY6427325.1 hypothetical protein [Bacteroidales bacterium]
MSTVNYTLVAPLNWGLGHAARVIPIIKRLVNEEAEVMIGGNGESLKFLRAEFPNLKYVELPGVDIKYSSGKSQVWAVLRQLPSIIHYSIKEHRAVKSIVLKYGINTVISDNRFGLYGSGVESIYITHQIMVKMPHLLKWLEPIVYRIHRHVIECFNECWIPDYADSESSLAGDLTHKYPLPRNARFIGPLSRFTSLPQKCRPVQCDVLIILSGVEPHRTMFEKVVVERFRNSEKKVVLVRGKAGFSNVDYGNIEVHGVMTAAEILPYIVGAGKVISRCGYTTVMDMHLLKKTNVEWSATPGQTEQEYLLYRISSLKHSC